MTTQNTPMQKMIALRASALSPVFGRGPACLDTAIGKAARGLFDTEASLSEVETGHAALADLLAAAPMPGLLYLMAPETGAKGLIWLDPLLVNALIELETGAPDNSVLKDPRVPTLTDATLSKTFVDALFDRLSDELNRAAEAPSEKLAKYQADRHEIDAKQLAFALEPCRYCWIGGTLSFQGGVRGGAMRIALPESAWGQRRQTAAGTADPIWRAALVSALGRAPMTMKAVLEVVEMPLGQALTLREGDLIPISETSLSDLRLTALDGTAVFEGHLGQHKGRKAISLTGSPLAPWPKPSPVEDSAPV